MSLTDDQIAAERKMASMSYDQIAAELKMARRSYDLPPEGPDRPAPSTNGRSLSDRAGDEVEVGEQYPLGTISGDPKVTFKGLIKPGRPVEVTASLTAAEVPIENGKLLDPDKSIQVLVTVLPAEAVLKYKRDPDDDTVKGYKIRQPLRTAYVQSAEDMYGAERVKAMIQKALFLVGVTESERAAEIIEDVMDD